MLGRVSGILLFCTVLGFMGCTEPPLPIVQYTLTVTTVGSGSVGSAPGGIDCGASCGADIDSGTEVTLAATPDVGYSFDGWSGACSGTGTCVVRPNVLATAVPLRVMVSPVSAWRAVSTASTLGVLGPNRVSIGRKYRPRLARSNLPTRTSRDKA